MANLEHLLQKQEEDDLVGMNKVCGFMRDLFELEGSYEVTIRRVAGRWCIEAGELRASLGSAELIGEGATLDEAYESMEEQYDDKGYKD